MMVIEKLKCFCCDREIEIETENTNPTVITPAYDALWFRAPGNFGSRILIRLP